MKQGYRGAAALLAIAAWVAVAYAVRYGLMEHTAWVGACALAPERLPCQARAGMGLVIHWAVLPWAGAAFAVAGWCVGARPGKRLAGLGLALAIPGLVLYTTSLAAVVAMVAGLRLVRAEPAKAQAMAPTTSAQPQA